jgi:hypothetical protein
VVVVLLREHVLAQVHALLRDLVHVLVIVADVEVVEFELMEEFLELLVQRWTPAPFGAIRVRRSF